MQSEGPVRRGLTTAEIKVSSLQSRVPAQAGWVTETPVCAANTDKTRRDRNSESPSNMCHRVTAVQLDKRNVCQISQY